MSTHDLYVQRSRSRRLAGPGLRRGPLQLGVRRRPRPPPRPVPEGQGQAVGRQPSASTGTWRSTRTTRSAPPTRPSPIYGTPLLGQDDRRRTGASCASTTPPGSSASSCTASRARWSARRGSWSPCPTWTRSSTPPPRPWTRPGTPRSTAASCTRRSGCSTRSTTTSRRCSATPSATPAGTCRTSACRCSSRAWRWPPSA